MKGDQCIEMKMKAKGEGEGVEVLAGELGDDVVYPETPIVLLGEGQKIELVAKAKIGKGINHAKFMPGLAFYKHLPKIKISMNFDLPYRAREEATAALENSPPRRGYSNCSSSSTRFWK